MRDISIAIIESFTKLREFTESESTVELNLAILKVKRTIKKKTTG